MRVGSTPDRCVVGAAVVAVLAGLLAGCGQSSSGGGTAGGHAVAISLTSQGCRPDPATVPAGLVTFTVKNDGAQAVTEAELLNGGRILGERENITPGLSGTFSLRLSAGDYQVYCPGGHQTHWPFRVTGTAGNAALSAPLATAVSAYRRWVIEQVVHLDRATRTFAAAVRTRDIGKAKTLYPTTRAYYERIEPVAESFGSLDPAIDARINDVARPSRWTGFHRIEQALWSDRSLSGMTSYANQLVADVGKLRGLVAHTTYQPAQLANGAVSLLDEVAKTKVTGEEERYSHTDLWDFAANVQGAHKAFTLLLPTLRSRNPALATTVSQRFTDVQRALQPYRRHGGYVDYSTVGAGQRRVLAELVDALAEPLSQVAGAVTVGA